MILEVCIRLTNEIVEIGSRRRDDDGLHTLGRRSRKRRADDGGFDDAGEWWSVEGW